jgi:predicted nuclease of predicted toxin-antitoxin system
MRFLVDADLPRSAADVVRHHGHEAVDVRDIGLRSTKDPEVARYAQREGCCLISGDYDFADIRNYPPDQYAGIVVLYLPPTATATYIDQLLDSFLEHEELLAQLPGKLAIVEPGRVRLRAAKKSVMTS